MDQQPHQLDKCRYDMREDLYRLRVSLPPDLAPGRYKWELTASDGAAQPHCARRANRSLWFEFAAVNQPGKSAASTRLANGLSSPSLEDGISGTA